MRAFFCSAWRLSWLVLAVCLLVPVFWLVIVGLSALILWFLGVGV